MSVTGDMGARIQELEAVNAELLAALSSVLDLYVDLANSGDAGFWDPEDVNEVKAARAAIAKARGWKT